MLISFVGQFGCPPGVWNAALVPGAWYALACGWRCLEDEASATDAGSAGIPSTMVVNPVSSFVE